MLTAKSQNARKVEFLARPLGATRSEVGSRALGALRERIRALEAARLALADEVLGLVRPLYSVIPSGWTPGDLWALHEAVAQVRNHLYRESEVLGLLTTEIHEAIGRAEERCCGTVEHELPF